MLDQHNPPFGSRNPEQQEALVHHMGTLLTRKLPEDAHFMLVVLSKKTGDGSFSTTWDKDPVTILRDIANDIESKKIQGSKLHG